jgi:hypothetical protein
VSLRQRLIRADLIIILQASGVIVVVDSWVTRVCALALAVVAAHELTTTFLGRDTSV